MLKKDLNVIILAAGENKRMLSNIPKVMHKIAGKSMLQYLIDELTKIDVQSIYIIYNYYNKDILIKTINFHNTVPVYWILQRNLSGGTGDAVNQALPMMHDNSDVLILYGDVPFISYKTLKELQYVKYQCDISLLTAHFLHPNGYGRIIRNEYDQVMKIIEHNDIIDENHKKITEINSGIFITESKYLKDWLKILIDRQLKSELYLTDVISIAYEKKFLIRTVQPVNKFEVTGINSKLDLIKVEREYQKQQAQYLLELGVMISDPNRFDLRGTLLHGMDVYIDINVIIEGNVSLGDRVNIGANCILKNVFIENDVIVYPFSIIENSTIKCKSRVGPFARLRPGNLLQENTQIGNFVELKNMHIGTQSKVGHLTYLGDAKIGSGVNIGAGTVICNYDGLKKNYSNIADNVFIGAGTQIVSPLTIDKNATIGAGTTVTQDVSAGETIISRIRQFPILRKKSFQKKEEN